jgi:hypothetical protein
MRMPSALLLLLTAGTASAGSGRDGFQFLSQDMSARAAGMGQAAVAVADDVNAAFWNPAGLGDLRRREISTGYAGLLEEGSLGLLSYAHPLNAGSLGFSLRVLRSGDVAAYDAGDQRIGTYDAQDQAVSLSYGHRAGTSWRWGLTVKQVSESIADAEAKTFAGDAGLLFHPFWSGRLLPFKLAVGIRNVGSDASFLREKTSLPRAMDAGASYTGFSEALTIALDAHKARSGETSFNGGAEVWLHNVLAFRAGIASGGDLGNGLSMGIGFKFKDVRVDYAFQGYGDGFGASHRMGLTFRFGGAGERAYQEGLRLSQQGQHAEAILKFEEALDADPRHAGAARALRESVRLLEREMKSDEGNGKADDAAR